MCGPQNFLFVVAVCSHSLWLVVNALSHLRVLCVRCSSVEGDRSAGWAAWSTGMVSSGVVGIPALLLHSGKVRDF